MTVWPYMCYFIRLRGTKERQECAYYKITLRSSQCPQAKDTGRIEKLKKSNRGARGTRDVQQRPYTELKIHNTEYFII